MHDSGPAQDGQPLWREPSSREIETVASRSFRQLTTGETDSDDDDDTDSDDEATAYSWRKRANQGLQVLVMMLMLMLGIVSISLMIAPISSGRLHQRRGRARSLHNATKVKEEFAASEEDGLIYDVAKMITEARSYREKARHQLLWVEFRTVKVRDPSGCGQAIDAVQIAEIRFSFDGTVVSMAGAKASDPKGESPPNERPELIVDGSVASKWYDGNKGALRVKFPNLTSVDAFSFTTGNDCPERDPVQWEVHGSIDGTTWFPMQLQRTDFNTPSERMRNTSWISLDFPQGALEVNAATENDTEGTIDLINASQVVHTAALNGSWNAFEVTAFGEGAVAKTPRARQVIYQQLLNGTAACPPGLDITSADECALAAEALGIQTSSAVWQGSTPDAPRFCSVTLQEEGVNTLNMNAAPDGQGRADVTPLCLTIPKPSKCPLCVSSKRIIPAVVIPFYERDLCKFTFTARSLHVNDPNLLLGDFYFMWVSYSSAWGYMDQINDVIAEVNGTHSTHFYDLSYVVQGGGMPGWIAQQVLKLKIASIIDSDYYMVLDSKNTLIKDLKMHTLVTPCNQAINFAAYSAWNLPEPHRTWYRNTASHLGVPWPAGGQWSDSISPMILKTSTVRSLLAAIHENEDIHALCRGPLCSWLKGQSATEFILYQLYARFRTTDYECSHAIQWPIVGSMWRGKTTAALIAKQAAWSTFFGAQSGAFGGIWGYQRTLAGWKLRDVYVNAGLLDGNDSTINPSFTIGCFG